MLEKHSTPAPIPNKGALLTLPQTLKSAIAELSEIQDLVQLIVDSCRYSGVSEVQSAGNVGYLLTHRLDELIEHMQVIQTLSLSALEGE